MRVRSEPLSIYVTGVYRAHSFPDKDEGCDIPLSVPSLFTRHLRADNSVTGGLSADFALRIFKIGVFASAVAGNETRADVFTTTGMPWHSTRSSVPNAISSTQLRSVCDHVSLLQGLRRVTYVSNKLRLHRIFTNFRTFRQHSRICF